MVMGESKKPTDTRAIAPERRLPVIVSRANVDPDDDDGEDNDDDEGKDDDDGEGVLDMARNGISARETRARISLTE
jgi:hypothetical protein